MEKHRAHDWRTPILAASQQAFDSISSWINPECPLIIDSGCGTGHGVIQLAERHPDAQILGIDQSQARLRRAPAVPDNARLIRARVEDVWRLLLMHQIPVARHYLLYPNPWPKPRHLMRRWHAHPAFPSLIQLGGKLELRTNWKPYAEEFRMALEYYSLSCTWAVLVEATEPTTLFERKYLASGHSLYRLNSTLTTS